MSDRQAKKLNLALYLNPLVSEADREAMTALQQWYEQAKQSCSERGELDDMIRLFHHDLYLAGLRLHLINPRLCRHVAESLEQTDLTLEALAEQLSACGLWAGPRESSFSADQLQQLEHLLAAAPASAAAVDAPANADDTETSALSHQLTEQREQLTAMHTELQELRALAEEQARQLRQMKLAVPAPARPKSAHAGGAEEMDVTDMGAQIAQMQKIREKGVF